MLALDCPDELLRCNEWIDHGPILPYEIHGVFFPDGLCSFVSPPNYKCFCPYLFYSSDYFSYNVPIMGRIGGRAMEGVYFYIVSWFGWWIATFWMKQTANRFYIATGFLLLLLSSGIHISVGVLSISGSLLFILVLCLLGICPYPWWKTLYLFICMGIVAMFYATIQLMVLYDPIWFLKGNLWISSSVMAFLIFLMARTYREKLLVLGISIVQGETLLSVVLWKFQFHNEIGTLYSLDVLMCVFCLVSIYTAFGKSKFLLDLFKQKQVREGKSSL